MVRIGSSEQFVKVDLESGTHGEVFVVLVEDIDDDKRFNDLSNRSNFI